MKEILTLKVLKKDAQKKIKEIKEEDNFNNNYKIENDEKHIYIPIKNKKNYKNIIYLKNLKKQKKNVFSYKDHLKNKVSKAILEKLPSSYDIVGDIIIINIEEQEISKKYGSIIGSALKNLHTNIKSVFDKAKEHHGRYRTQDLEWLWGENDRTTEIIENGCSLKTDTEKVFFSTRLSTERKRTAKLVKNKEIVGVFFAGVGPFAIIIGKISKPKEIVAIELNPVGYKYLKENIKKNKMEKLITPIKGDVKKVSKKYKNYFDRILMPLPKSAETFLDDAIFSIKNKGIVHIYNFVPKNKPYEDIKKIIKEKEKKNNCKIKINFKKVIRSFSKTTVQIVMDLKIFKTS
jgi:tRNA (guanine37-N1)-methyltransferase